MASCLECHGCWVGLFLEYQGIRFTSKKNIIPKLSCVGLVKCFEVEFLFLDELYAEPDCIEWI